MDEMTRGIWGGGSDTCIVHRFESQGRWLLPNQKLKSFHGERHLKGGRGAFKLFAVTRKSVEFILKPVRRVLQCVQIPECLLVRLPVPGVPFPRFTILKSAQPLVNSMQSCQSLFLLFVHNSSYSSCPFPRHSFFF